MSANAPPVSVGNPTTLKLGRALVQKLAICLRTSRLYERANITVQESAQGVVDTIRNIHQMEGSVQLALILDYLTLNDTRLKSDLAGHATFQYMAEGLDQRGIGAIRFANGTTADEILGLCAEFHRVRIGDEEDPFGEFEEGLKRAGLRSITVEEKMTVARQMVDESLKKDVKERSVNLFFQSIGMAREILESSDPRKMNFKKAKRVIQQMVDSITEEEYILLSLTSIKNYDQYTFNHSANVAVYSIAFGQKIGMGRQELADLGMSGLFHDIGKTQVPKEILNKPARLERDEWELMKNHSVYGASILLQSRQLTDSTIRNILVAFEHHLNLDLGGYPTLTDRRELNLFSKIVAIADCFDALTTPRVYRSTSYSPQEALSIMMEGRGTLFDPTLLKIFVNTIGIHPIGTLVELGSGEMAIVFRTNGKAEDLDRPFVKIFADSRGNRVEEKVVDLSEKDPETGNHLHSIVRTVDPGDYFASIEDYLEIL